MIQKTIIVGVLCLLGYIQLGFAQKVSTSVELVGESIVSTNRKQFPDRANNTDRESRPLLSDWIDILPTHDFGADTFIVYPKMGLITPLHTINFADQAKVKNGKMFDHYRYLEQGVLKYAGSQIGDETGTAIIAGHSSFRDDTYNPYYTVFQSVPLSQVGDQIWVYTTSGNKITRYIYEIQESYEVDPSQRAKVEEQKPYASITTYSCYPIGSNASRRVNHAKLIKTDIQGPDVYHNASVDEKIQIENQPNNLIDETSIYENTVNNKVDQEQIPEANKLMPSNSMDEKKARIIENIANRNKTGGSSVLKSKSFHDTISSVTIHTSASGTPKNIFEKKSISIQELTALYKQSRTNVYYKIAFIKILVQLQQNKKTIIRN